VNVSYPEHIVIKQKRRSMGQVISAHSVVMELALHKKIPPRRDFFMQSHEWDISCLQSHRYTYTEDLFLQKQKFLQ
jgi:hypothetical protein